MNKGDSVSEDENLLRRVYRKDKRFRNPKTGILSLRAFAPRPKNQGKLSIYPVKFVLYRISNSLVKNLGLNCIYDPIFNEDYENLAHALIIGFDEEDSLPGILARKAEFIDYP